MFDFLCCFFHFGSARRGRGSFYERQERRNILSEFTQSFKALQSKEKRAPRHYVLFCGFWSHVKFGYEKVDDMFFFISQLLDNIFWPFFRLIRLSWNFIMTHNQCDQIEPF